MTGQIGIQNNVIFWLCLAEKDEDKLHQAEISKFSVDHTTDFTFLLTADRRVRHRRGGRRDDGARRGEEHRGV